MNVGFWMKHIAWLSIWLLVITACARLPDLKPTASDRIVGGKPACHRQFLKKEWRLVHFIEAQMNDRHMGGFYGVSIISPEPNRIHSVLMTLEGFTLFDGYIDPSLVINRAVAPFDTEAFARGLFSDIRLIFLKPEAMRVEFGILYDGSSACRYWMPDKTVVDMIRETGNRWTLKQYSPKGNLLRTITMDRCEEGAHNQNDRLPCTVAVTGYRPKYKLELKLLEAEMTSSVGESH